MEYESWLEKFDNGAFIRAWVQYSQSEWQKWCRIDEIVSHLVQGIEPMPKEIAPCPYSDLITLSWRIQMRDTSLDYQPSSSLYENGEELESVVCLVLQKLKRWIWGSEKEDEFQSLEQKFDCLEWPINPQQWSAQELAYFILKGTHSWGFGPRRGIFWPLRSWQSRIPRVAFGAYLFGLYAGLYHAISSAKRKGIKSWNRLERFQIKDYLLLRNEITPSGLHMGTVMFPKVHGLPILQMLNATT